MEHEQLVRAEGQACISFAVAIAKLHLEDPRCKRFDHGAHLASMQSLWRQVFQQGDNVKQLDILHALHLRGGGNSSSAENHLGQVQSSGAAPWPLPRALSSGSLARISGRSNGA